MTKENRRCVFCGGDGLSAEHVLPKWMKKEIPSPTGPNYRSYYLKNDEVIKRNFLMKGQSAFDQTVSKVCIKCNNGWMSNLEGKVRNNLLSLIIGEPTPMMESDFPALSLWAVKTAIVRALVDAGDNIVPKSHYDSVMNGIIPDNLIVYIGKYTPEEMTIASRFIKGYINNENIPHYTCSYFIYFFFLHIFYVGDTDFYEKANKIDAGSMFEHGLIKIHPIENNNRILQSLKPSIDIDPKIMSGLIINLLTDDINMPPEI
ncbi:hypothetical protein [Serratia quinivorans]|uniref:hypothetical protein n=1 Tax=Serratia quinivorans TaxID=137545 RepID=UPI00217A524D|nr:hypothetical protein [Serratia quinivorans]CAI0722405.1 Uncharacterised protein [Serratia quinivorans]